MNTIGTTSPELPDRAEDERKIEAGYYSLTHPCPRGTCIVCKQYTTICCANVTYQDGTHADPVCENCCYHEPESEAPR